MKALALMVWDKKIFQVFSLGCHSNQSSSWNSNLWSFLKVHHPRIISVKFHWNLLAGFRGEDFLSNCSWTDASQWSITIAHPENVVLRWAKNFLLYLYVKSENPQHRTNFYSRAIIWSILVEDHYMMLHAKYESSSPYGLGQEDFYKFPSLSLWNLRTHIIGLISTPGP